MIQSSPTILQVPPAVASDICKYLNPLEMINACSTIPNWKWILFSQWAIMRFNYHMSKWAWVDKPLCELVLLEQPISVDNVCKAVLHHSKQAEVFQQNSSVIFASSSAMTHFRCLLMGPAVDTVGLLDSFYATLLHLMPKKSKGQAHPRVSNGIPICIALGNKGRSVDLLIEVSTLHARVRSRREIERSRVNDSLIMDSDGLSKQAEVMMKSSDFIFYMLHGTSESTNWEEVQWELSNVCRRLSSNQILLIIYVNETNESTWGERSHLFDIVQNLGGLEHGPLSECQTNWQMWYLKKTGSNYVNLVDILKRACVDVATKRVNFTQDNPSMLSIIWRLIRNWS